MTRRGHLIKLVIIPNSDRIAVKSILIEKTRQAGVAFRFLFFGTLSRRYPLIFCGDIVRFPSKNVVL